MQDIQEAETGRMKSSQTTFELSLQFVEDSPEELDKIKWMLSGFCQKPHLIMAACITPHLGCTQMVPDGLTGIQTKKSTLTNKRF